MKTVTCEVVTTVKVTIFERGDLIVYHRKDHNANHYGLVLKDQDPKNPNRVKVRDLKQCRDSIWTNINEDEIECSKCRLVMHLDDVLIDEDNGLGIPVVL